MSRKKREEEAKIIQKLLSDDGKEPAADPARKKSEKSHTSEIKTTKKDADIIRCPRCGYVLTERSACPRCGYNGYVPMSKSQTRKVKLILYPILLVIAILVYLYINGYFG